MLWKRAYIILEGSVDFQMNVVKKEAHLIRYSAGIG
jgi:hypothetical protein